MTGPEKIATIGLAALWVVLLVNIFPNRYFQLSHGGILIVGMMIFALSLFLL